MYKKNLSVVSLVVLLSLTLSLAFPTSALADDAPPPAAESTEVTTPPSDEGDIAPESPSTEDVDLVGGDSTIVEETTLTEEATSVEGSSTDSAEEVPLLALIPEGTDVIVLDESGIQISLASQEAVEVMEIADPMWCPHGATTVTSECVNHTTVTGLLGLLGSKNDDGVIYFTSSYIANDAIFDGTNANLASISDNALTLQGGWNGTTTLGSTITYTASGISTFSVPLVITNWTGNIFVNDITINSITTASSLQVYTDGDITLDNVRVSQQAGGYNTAILDSAGGDIEVLNGSNFDGNNGNNRYNQGFSASAGSGSITITGTNANRIQFTDSQGAGGTNYSGLTLDAQTITLDYVTVDDSDGDGITIATPGANVNMDHVTVTDSGQDGIHIVNAADVTIDQITANNNRGTGIAISDASSVSIDHASVDVNNQDADGINVVSSGDVTISNSSVLDGDLNGISVEVTGTGNAFLSNVNVTSGDNGSGVIVTTTSGDITLDDVDVLNQEDQHTANLISTSGNIFVTNSSSFDGQNNNLGFNAITDSGSIEITGTAGSEITFTQAQGGSGTNNNGANLSAPTISLVYASATGNDGNGFYIYDANQVTLENVTASSNGTNITGGTGTGGFSNDVGSGVLVNGASPTSVEIIGGVFNSNQRYGIEVLNGSIYVASGPSSCNNDGGCYYPASPVMDRDLDHVANADDNCPDTYNLDQADSDEDGTGNACDSTPNGDFDEDEVDNESDNCPETHNPDQADSDEDGTGNACDSTPNGDFDEDEVDNESDNCPETHNPDQADSDEDGTGNACDSTPNGDFDEDEVDNESDNCPETHNPDQADSDGDGTGDACDSTPNGNGGTGGPANTGGDGTPTGDGDVIAPSGFVPLLIPVTGGQGIELSCVEPFLTVEEMEELEVSFSSMCGFSAVLSDGIENSKLDKLPADGKFISGINVTLLKDGAPVDALPAGSHITLSFEIPAGVDAETLSVLFWDEEANAWVEMDVTIRNGKVIAEAKAPGTYVLVDKSASAAHVEPSSFAQVLNGLYWTMTGIFKQIVFQ